MTTRKLHILIAGTNTTDFVLLSNYLNQAFNKPVLVYCQNLKNAVAICKTVVFDVLISDVDFSQHTEKELFNSIFQAESAPVVIFLTEQYQEDFALEIILAGAQDCLPKAALNSRILYQSITFAVARQLRKSEIPVSNPYQKLFAQNPLPVVIYEVESKKVVLANEAAADFYGYSLPKFAALSIADLQPEDKLIFAGQKKHRTKNGRLILVEVLTNLIQINQKTCRQIVVIDLAKRIPIQPKNVNEMQQQLVLLQN
ncbi:MAG: response regulator [Janthinobacterium lividum]